MKRVFIYENPYARSAELAELARKKLSEAGFETVKAPDSKTDLVLLIGGDGTLLKALREFDYPSIPMVGLNTGHLGFFQEFTDGELNRLINTVKAGDYSVQEHRLLECVVTSKTGREYRVNALNEVVIIRDARGLIHLDLTIGDKEIETFSGDGLAVSTPAGSTAYNYSLGGPIIDQRVSSLIVTPIAPSNNRAFRTLTSSLVLPPMMQVKIAASGNPDYLISIVSDGGEETIEGFSSALVQLTEKTVKLIRLPDYNFWGKVKEKLL